MNIRQRTVIDRPAATVWPYILNPGYFQKWNEKIVSMEARDAFRLGESFVTHYRWGRRQLQCLSVATQIEAERLLELRHSHFVGTGVGADMEVTERITLEERDHRSIVTKHVRVRNHRLPWLLVPLIWLISRFGKPVKEDSLKSMCEGKSTGS